MIKIEKNLLKSVLGILFSALLITFSFPKFNISFLSFFFLVPAILGIFNQDRRKIKLALSVLFGFLIFLFTFYWTVITIHHFGKMNMLLSLVLYVPLSIYQMLPFIAWLYFFKFQYEKSLFIPCLTFPLITNFMPLIFPYSISSSLSHYLYLPQFASVVGEWGLDFILILSNVLIFKVIKERSRKLLLFPIMIFIFLISFGYFKIHFFPIDNSKKLNLIVIQPCILDKDSDDVALKKLFVLIDKIKGNCKGKTVILPESSIPDSLGIRNNFLNIMEEIRSQLKSDRIIYNHTVYKNGKFYNSSFLTTKEKTEIYFKNKLMLFGEKFPFHFIIKKLPLYVANFASFESGNEIKTLNDNNIKFATPICLEAVFQDYTAEISSNANIIVNQTNDEWFGNTRATFLHFAQVRMKAIECGKFIIRSTNTGYTTVIDNHGRELNNLELNKPGILEVEVNLLNNKTVFSYIHKFIPFVYFLLILILILKPKTKVKLSK